MATKAKPKPKKIRQKRLPGTEGESIREIDDAADAYHDCKTERSALSVREKELMDALVEVMQKHNLTSYETADGILVTATSKTKCSTAKKDAEGDDEPEE